MIGDKLASAMSLFGHPSCINTAKCLQTAGEKGIDVETHVIQSGDEVTSMSPLGSAPVLKDLDNVVYGTGAILSYLDDKGFGPSLVPRNGVIRAQMYQWGHVAADYVQAQAAAVGSGGGDRALLTQALDMLEQQLQTPRRRDVFVCGSSAWRTSTGAPASTCWCMAARPTWWIRAAASRRGGRRSRRIPAPARRR